MKRESIRDFGILSAAFLALFSLPVLLPALLTWRLPAVLQDLVPVFPAAALILLVLFCVQTVSLFLLMRECRKLPPAKPKLRLAVFLSLALMLGGAAGILGAPGGTAFFGTWSVHGFLLYEVFLAILLWKRLPETPPHWLGVVCCICAGCFALYIVAAWGVRLMLDRRAMADDEAARAAGSVQSWKELAERYYHGEKPDPDLDKAIRLALQTDGSPEELYALWEKLLAKPGPLKAARNYDERFILQPVPPEMQLYTLMFLREENKVFPELLRQGETGAALRRWKSLGDWLDTTVADSQMPGNAGELFFRMQWLDMAQLLKHSGKLAPAQKAEMVQRLAQAEKVHREAWRRTLYPEMFFLAARTELYIRTGGDIPRAFQRKKPLLGSYAAFPAYAVILFRRIQTMRHLIAAVKAPENPPPQGALSGYWKIWKHLLKRFQTETGGSL